MPIYGLSQNAHANSRFLILTTCNKCEHVTRLLHTLAQASIWWYLPACILQYASICQHTQHMPACASICEQMPAYGGICQNMLPYANMCQHTPARASICQHMPAYGGICQYMLAYASMCQHMPACASICQPVLAYASI